MLYISRQLGVGKYGVFDTDDMSETACTFAQIEKIVRDYGLEIKGVTTLISPKSGKPYVSQIEVQQNADSVTLLQTKAYMLYGVVIKTHEQEITKIDVPSGLRVPRATIRLSDYGTSCSDNIVNSLSIQFGHELILVLDDRIKIKRGSFSSMWPGSNVKLSLEEVTKASTIKSIYLCDSFNRTIDCFEEIIIDRQERKDFYKGFRAVKGIGLRVSEYPVDSEINVMLKYPIEDLSKVSEMVAAQYRKEFEVVCTAEFSPCRHKPDYKNYIEAYAKDAVVRSMKGTNDFELCWRARRTVFFLLNNIVLIRDLSPFLRYMTLLPPTEHMKELYTTLCRNLVDLIDKEYACR